MKDIVLRRGGAVLRMSIGRRIKLRVTLSMILGVVAASKAHAGGVRIVEPTGTSNYPNIQAAVDAAVNGDVVLVGAGVYSGFTIPYKALIVAAAPNGGAIVHGSVQIQGLLAGREVALIGLEVSGSNDLPALWVSNCAGHVLLQDCSFTGGGGPYSGVDVTMSNSVALVRCTATGSLGYSDFGDFYGGDGVRCSNSSLAVYDCSLVGGDAQQVCDYPPGDGGWGYRGEPGSLLVASGSSARGGKGGNDCFCGKPPGKGGAGFAVGSGSALNLLDITATSGPPGISPCGINAGSYPEIYNQGGTVTMYPGPARKLSPTQAVASDNSIWSLSISGSNGDRIYLPGSRTLGFSWVPSTGGVWLIGVPTGPTQLLGLVPSTGVLAAQKAVPDVPLPLTHRAVFSQVVAADSANERFLGAPAARIVLNRESGPDCNGNGVQDYVEILEGLVPDVNHNLIPDTCPGG